MAVVVGEVVDDAEAAAVLVVLAVTAAAVVVGEVAVVDLDVDAVGGVAGEVGANRAGGVDDRVGDQLGHHQQDVVPLLAGCFPLLEGCGGPVPCAGARGGAAGEVEAGPGALESGGRGGHRGSMRVRGVLHHPSGGGMPGWR
ncbi:hypothetical protein [Streptomyces sp. HNA39]|uniref:hypothetical protein n=1 Tax=Streptomyces sp. HNA39 TaxID=2850561 RepID=UPI00200F1D11|nr:hypothetical protein [Streptomyces sp. HNA39]